MGALSDAFGGPICGFWLATGLAVTLAGAAVADLLRDPAEARLEALDQGEPAQDGG